MKKPLFFLAVTGWVLGLTVHLLSVANIDLTEKAPYVWLLHIGIFAVWLPAVLELRNNKEFKKYRDEATNDSMNPVAFYKLIFSKTPTWFAILALGGFAYAMINFMLFITSQAGVPDIQEGQYVLHNHGEILRTITEQEYHHYKANEVRGFSGHWMAFYGMAAAILFPFKKRGNTSSQNK
ncbi:hypothetical protein R9C00_25195 [Flammeovirgaceae bacterium SG7u.111]|nr:hypothetical protein [Flammeovirgaceae bacterium SG7u.132]WPO34994.1 hypothetical protein R9C00_25195 [Flammeovirgaceae bacterium SG7u.111]